VGGVRNRGRRTAAHLQINTARRVRIHLAERASDPSIVELLAQAFAQRSHLADIELATAVHVHLAEQISDWVR
jgi:hypothetical protein